MPEVCQLFSTFAVFFNNVCSLAAKESIFDVSNFQLKECNPSELNFSFDFVVLIKFAGFRWTCDIQAASISHNHLSLFPLGLCLCTSLTVLTLSDNILSQLPDGTLLFCAVTYIFCLNMSFQQSWSHWLD